MHNFYVPAGGDEPDPAINVKFAHKLAFLDELHAMAEAAPRPKTRARSWSATSTWRRSSTTSGRHKQMLKVVSHTPIECERPPHSSRPATGSMRCAGSAAGTEKLYTWWSYRSIDWKAADRGRRLDHIWVSPQLGDRVSAIDIGKIRARLGAAVGPRAGDGGDRGLRDEQLLPG